MADVCLVQRLLDEHKESDPLNVIWIILGLIDIAFSLSLWMITCNCLSKNDPVCGNYRYLSLNLEYCQIPKIVVFVWKMAFLTQNFNIYFFGLIDPS